MSDKKWVIIRGSVGLYDVMDAETREAISCQLDLETAKMIACAPVQQELIKQLVDALKTADEELEALWGFWGQGLQVAGWHLNGDLQSLDSFFEDNCFEAREKVEAAIKSAAHLSTPTDNGSE